MISAAQLSVKDHGMQLKGRIDFDNAAEVYEQGVKLLKQHAKWPLVIDLSDLALSNTIALAIFVQWVRQCGVGQNIVLTHVPEKMQAIIQASNLQAAFA